MRKYVLALMIAALTLMPLFAHAGGDKNTLRGSEGEQIGEPAPDPVEEPDKDRAGDPNPDMDNVPQK